jgi:hypothetical protein
VCLQVVRREFAGRPIPTLSEYGRSHGLHRDTIRRASDAVLPRLRELLEARRPGPQQPEVASAAIGVESHPAFLALQALNALLLSAIGGSILKLFGTPEKRGKVVEETLRWKARGLELGRLASWLGLSVRTLRRWIARAEPGAQGTEVPHGSRRPESSPSRTPEEIREAIFKLGRLMKGESVSAIAAVFRRQYKQLLEDHGLKTIADKTIGRYLNRPGPPEPPRPPSRRGEYDYPPPFAMAWIDTTYFTVAGIQVHIVGAMEAFSRMMLGAEVFVQENAEASVHVLSSVLRRVPELAAVVRDRGKPYLNERVNDFLALNGCLPIDAHPYWPIDKAALERWWGALKPWLKEAVSTFENRCALDGHAPTAQDVIEIVRSALRVVVRAYNLLPQKSFEETCPFERLEAALKEVREHDGDDSLLRRLHAQRRDRDSILSEVRDALQLPMDVIALRKQLVGLSKRALEYALKACHRVLVLERQSRIRWPLAYLRAVAWNEERRVQAEEERRERVEKERLQRLNEEKRRHEEQKRLSEDRRRHPDKYLIKMLRFWLLGRASGFLNRLPLASLWQILRALRLQGLSTYQAQIRRAHDSIPELLADINPAYTNKAAELQQQFQKLTLAALKTDAVEPPNVDPPKPGSSRAPQLG